MLQRLLAAGEPFSCPEGKASPLPDREAIERRVRDLGIVIILLPVMLAVLYDFADYTRVASRSL